jgi:tetratricopeptide (TPR) repeat protein
MLHLNRRTLMIFTLVIVMGWASNAVAHHRGGLPLVHPVVLPVAQPQAPPEGTTGPLALQADSYWQRLLAQEQTGDLGEAIKTGLALANIFPQSPQTGAALLKAGELARKQGKTGEALELFDLACSLAPGTPEASQACLAASALELARDLHQGDPVQSLRQFLGRTSHLSPGYSPELFQEALKTGWQAVASQVQGATPLPLSLVEEILALWDLQPKGLGPPEAARLLASLLQKKGLMEEAQALLAGAAEKNRSNQPDMPKSYSLKQTGLSGCQAGLLGAPNPTSLREMEQKFYEPACQLRFQAGVEPVGTPGEDLLSWFLPRPAHAAWLEGRLPPLGKNLMQSWSPLQLERSRLELARPCTPEGPSPPEAQAPQPMASQPVGHAQGPFSQYCLGVNRLQDGHPEEAQATFQELAQNHDPFWQSLARVRLADLELSRLQAEPAP